MTRKKLYLLPIAGLIGLFFTCLLLLAALQMGPVQRILLELAQERLLESSGIQLRIEGIHGFVPFDLQVDRMAFRDEDGPIASLKQARLDVSVRHLLLGRLVVAEISAAEVHLQRLPQNREPAKAAVGDQEWDLSLPGIPLVRVQKLSCPHIQLAEGFLGQAGILALQGGLTSSEEGETRIVFDLKRVDQPGLRISLESNFQRKGPSLKLKSSLFFPAGGLLREVLPDNLSRPIELKLNGTGGLDDWPGHLSLQLAGSECLSSRLNIRADQDSAWTVLMSGRIVPGPLLPAESSGLLQEEAVRFELRGSKKAQSQELFLDRLSLSCSLLSLELSGKLRPKDGTVSGTLTAELPELGKLHLPRGSPLQGKARLSAAFQGPVQAPKVRAEAFVQGVSWQETALSDAELSLELHPASSSGYEAGQIQVEGLVNGLTFGAEPVSEDPVSLHLRGDWRPSGLAVEQAELRVGNQRAQLTGRLESNGTFQGQLRIDIPEIGDLKPLSGMDIQGGFDLRAEIEGNWRQEAVSSTVTMGVQELSGLPPPLTEIIGSWAQLEARADYSAPASISLERAELRTEGLRLAVEGRVGFDRKRFALDWKLVESLHLKLFQGMAQSSIRGELSGQGTLQGGFDRFSGSAVLALQDLATEGVQAEEAEIRIDLVELPRNPAGQISLSIRQGATRCQGQTSIRLWDGLLTLNGMRISGPQTTITGELRWPLGALPRQARLHLTSRDLTWLDRFVPQASGLPRGDLHLSLELEGRDGLRALQARLQADALQAELVRAGDLQLEAEAELSEQGPLRGTLSLEAKNLFMESLHIQTFSLSGSGTPEDFDFRLQLEGDRPQPVSLKTQGLLTTKGAGLSVSLASGRGTYDGLPFSWRQPLRGTFSRAEVSLEAPKLSLGQGQAEISFRLGRDTLRARLELKGLALTDLSSVLPASLRGKADLSFRASGTPTQPRIYFSLKARGLLPQGFEDSRIEPGSVEITGSFVDRSFELRLGLQQGRRDLLQAAIRLPMRLSFRPLLFQSQGEVQGTIRGDLVLSRLGSLVPLGPHEVGGTLSLNLRIFGPLERPRARGRIVLGNGRYENVQSGTLLEDIQAKATLLDDGLKIESLRATDGDNGQLKGQGQFSLDASQGFPFSLSLSLNDLHLIRLDRMNISSSGRLDFSGDLSRSQLSGELSLAPAELRMPEVKPKGLQGLKVIQTGDQEGGSAKNKPDNEESGFLRRMHLDLRVSIPSRFFVRGRGLDSEWTGKFTVQGTATEPRVSGRLSVKQGRFNFLTKRFRITEGVLQFSGQSPPKPFLELMAVHDADNLLVKISIVGSVTDPEIAIDSEPPYPRDEILSRLLFDRELSDITPVQAVQLALAVRTLTSGDQKGLMGRAQDLLSVDRVEIRKSETEEEGTVVGVGKYLGDDIYFQVEQDLQAQSRTVTVEIALTETISLETEMSGITQGVGLKWTYRY